MSKLQSNDTASSLAKRRYSSHCLAIGSRSVSEVLVSLAIGQCHEVNKLFAYGLLVGYEVSVC